MSKSVDALILINKIHQYYQVDSVVAEDNTHGLWDLRHTPERVSDTEKEQLWAGELYIHLGSIAYSLCQNELPTVGEPHNLIRGEYIRQLDAILPDHKEGPLLPEIPGHDLGLENLQIIGGSLYTHDFLVAHPELIPEFTAKNAIADKLIATRRGHEGDIDLRETFHSGKNAIELLEAALADLGLITRAFRRMNHDAELDS